MIIQFILFIIIKNIFNLAASSTLTQLQKRRSIFWSMVTCMGAIEAGMHLYNNYPIVTYEFNLVKIYLPYLRLFASDADIFSAYASYLDFYHTTSFYKGGWGENIYSYNDISYDYFYITDGVSVLFILLTTVLCLLCQMFVCKDQNFRKVSLLILSLELCLVLAFSVNNLLLFYIFFEATLLPMFFLVGKYGSRERRVRASFLLFFYTLIGSLMFLLGIMYLKIITGTFSISYIVNFWVFTEFEQIILWLAFFLAFAIKMPLFPFHVWLPEAHVEAPAVGSVLLAGILLKLGVYGIIRLHLSLFPVATDYYLPLIWVMAVLGIIYTSLTAIRQIDFKRIIAYSSVAHMNLIMLGLLSNSIIGIHGAIVQSIAHGLVSSALFFLIGMLYNRYHSRLISFYSGIVHLMPIYCMYFLFFTLANIAFPTSGNFVGEFLLLLGIFQNNFLIGILCTVGVVLCGAYSLWVFNRICFGNLKTYYVLVSRAQSQDLNSKEVVILAVLAAFTTKLGIEPKILFSMLNSWYY